jgi:hypothetical protein
VPFIRHDHLVIVIQNITIRTDCLSMRFSGLVSQHSNTLIGMDQDTMYYTQEITLLISHNTHTN